MAGSYPDAPGRQMAWDDDGTVAYSFSCEFDADKADADPEAPGAELTPTVMGNLNKAFNTSDYNTLVYDFGQVGQNGHMILVWIFPELRDIDGMFIACYSGAWYDGDLESSANTTNGIDGTWANQKSGSSFWHQTPSVYRNYRDSSEIFTLAVSGAKSLRLWMEGSNVVEPEVYGVHIYGEIASGQTPDRILFLDPDDSDNEFSKPLDFGDEPRGGTTNSDTFKIKNNSATLTAGSIQITAEALWESSGGWYTFSENDSDYYATLSVTGTLTAGSTKLIYMRQDIPGTELLGLHNPRIQCSVGSWT